MTGIQKSKSESIHAQYNEINNSKECKSALCFVKIYKKMHEKYKKSENSRKVKI